MLLCAHLSSPPRRGRRPKARLPEFAVSSSNPPRFMAAAVPKTRACPQGARRSRFVPSPVRSVGSMQSETGSSNLFPGFISSSSIGWRSLLSLYGRGREQSRSGQPARTGALPAATGRQARHVLRDDAQRSAATGRVAFGLGRRRGNEQPKVVAMTCPCRARPGRHQNCGCRRGSAIRRACVAPCAGGWRRGRRSAPE